MTNGSGEYAIAFSTNPDVRRTPDRRAKPSAIVDLPNDQMSPLFEAAVEAAEEAAINSLFAGTSMDGDQAHHIDALPVNEVVKLYRRARAQYRP
jgi:D-aminopeptidase